jgi:hypothetical protein
VWQTNGGREVIATLENLSESQNRVESAVAHIETAQIGMAHGLSNLTSLSMASLGVVSLSAGFMIWQMSALDRRLSIVGKQISDIQVRLDAVQQAHLQTSLDFLSKYDRAKSDNDLDHALKESTFATNLYRNLVNAEVGGDRRLVALNQCGRYYLLALTTQMRCLISCQDLAEAEKRIAGEQQSLAALAKTTFDEVLGKAPEAYLDPALKPDHVTLELLTKIYQQAHQLRVTTEDRYPDAAQVFEQLRPRLYGAGGWFGMVGKAKSSMLTKLKYLMACLEDVGRIESLRLRIADAIQGRLSFQELQQAVDSTKQSNQTPTASDEIMVFGLA